MTERRADTISGLFFIAIALAVGSLAIRLPETTTESFAGPGFMPTLLSICLAICGAVIIAQARGIPLSVRMPGWTGADLSSAIRIGVVAGATAAYNLLLEPVGYLLVTLAYLLFLLWYLKVSWKVNVVIAVVGTIATYAMFVVWLKASLPMGLIEVYF
ncbi:MAG TPA: tripartite tricarboxylate transporter TctB family protein [Chloroflexota bacterium]